MLKDLYQYQNNDLQIATSISEKAKEKKFVSNDIDISYYVSNGTYFFNINDNSNSTFMTYLHKIRQNY